MKIITAGEMYVWYLRKNRNNNTLCNRLMQDPSQILEKYWGYKAFRPLQLEIIESVLDNNDTLALLPTGGGKSICFQVSGINKKRLLPG